MKNENNTAYFLVYDESIKNLGIGEECEFYNWLKSEGFGRANIGKGFWMGVGWIYLNINDKTIAPGMPRIALVPPIGNHAITIKEFKVIYEIYKKYNGKAPLMFD